MSKSAIPSPARSQGAAPRRHKPRRTLSIASPARSDTSTKLVSVVGPYINDEKFAISPMQRRSVLPDDTEIEAPRRASWWKRLDGSSRDVLEALDTNKMPVDLPFDEEVEVEKEKQSQSLPETSDNESVASIVVPQRRLFNAKPQPQSKFGEILGSRKSLGKTNLDDDNTIYHLPKNLFNKDKSRNRPVFPAALLNSTNKTLNKTAETDVNEQQGRNLFGQANKRKKNMFTNFVMSESEDDSEIQHKVFGFKKNDNKRLSSGARKRRMPSLTPSVTTDIDMDDWNLLPSSTMIGNGSGQLEVSKISNDESEHMEVDDKDATLTEDTSKSKKKSLNRTRFSRSRKYQDESDKTLTNEDIEVEQASEKLDNSRNKTNTVNKTHTLSKSRKDKTLETAEASKKENEELKEKSLAQVTDQENRSNVKNNTDIEVSVEDQMAELHRESVNKEESNLHTEPTIEHQKSTHNEEATNVNEEDDMEKMVWNDNNQENEDVKDSDKSDIQDSVHEKTNKDASHVDEQNELGNEDDKSKEQVSIHDKTTKEVSADEEDNDHDSEDNESNEQDVHDKTTIKETSQDDEGNEHDGEDSHVANNSTKDSEDEDGVDQEDESNEQDNEESTVNEPSAEVSDDNDVVENQDTENEGSENEEMNEEATENNDDQNDVSKSEELNEDKVEQEIKTVTKSVVLNNTNTTKTLINASHKHAKPLVEEEIDQENYVVEGTPNSSYNTTGINRKKELTLVKSPETVLQNMSTDSVSFRPIGRSTSFRKSKVTIDDNLRHTLIPIQESIGSDGSRNSSTDGSGWDSHRTTRKTLRQTFGKDFTPRKSLRTLVMEKSAKRQTEADKNTSKNKNISGNKIDIEDQRIRDKRMSNRNVSNDQLPQSKSPALGVSAHHVSPQISRPRVSYNKSTPDINEAEILPEQSMEISQVQAQDDSGPEISMNASYGSGMSAVASHQESKNISAKKSFNKTTNRSTVKQASARIEENIQEEELDYDPSLQEDTTHSSKPEKSGQEIVAESENEIEAEDSDIEMADESQDDPQESDNEVEAEESQQEIEIEESEAERDPESEQEIEHEESQQEIEPESEQEIDHEESQQEIEPESEQEVDHEESQQDFEPESEQEVDHGESQQEIETESEQEEFQQEIEDESDHEAEQNVSQESVNETQEESGPESDRDSDGGREMDSEIESHDQNNSIPLDSPSKSSRQTERIVFDNEMSDQEVDYEVSERVSRQITNDDISDQDSEGENEEQMEYSVSARLSDQAYNQNISIATKKTMVMIQMEKIAQENMEMRLKIREKVQNSLKQKQDFNRFMSPIKSKFPVGRIKKPEPVKPLRKPRKPTALLMGPLPKEFVEDLKYKPPKRFQPANAPWITKRLYKFLESKLEPKYDYRARVRAEELVQNIYSLTKLARRQPAAPPAAVDELKREMARLNVVTTHFDFYQFFHEFMPTEVRVKVNPDIVNKIPMPRNGVFSDILQARPVG